MVGVGSRGDVVLLDRDPLADVDDVRTHLRGVGAALTVLDGEIIHRDLD